MIKKIVIRGVASYDYKGCTFGDLKKVNFIYGGNGTGKTTLSRFLAHGDDEFEIINNNGKKAEENPYDKCRMLWEDEPVDVLVYNQDFKQRNLTEPMPGVFTFGKNEVDRFYLKRKLYRQISRLEDSIRDKDELEKRINEEKEKVLKDKDLYSVEPSVDYMNQLLQIHNFTGFRIRTSPDQPFFYQIERRNGTSANETLSEGEATIITFLYFMQLVEGSGSSYGMRTRKVVVIDDPISSLDYKAIELVSTLTDELISKARKGDELVDQVIVLTHNTAFHQRLSVRQPRKNTHYWKLAKQKGKTIAEAFDEVNPVRSDYEMLWIKLKDEIKSNTIIQMPNLMRRIIETYFVGFGGYNKWKLFDGEYAKTDADRFTVKSLAKWMDEGSHGVRDDVYGGDYDVYVKMFKQLFKIMGQSEHYNMMMREEA